MFQYLPTRGCLSHLIIRLSVNIGGSYAYSSILSDGTIKKINMKPKVLLLKNDISSYNVPIYNTIAANYDLTVAYYRSNGAKEKCLFKLIKLNFSKLGPFIFIKGICQNNMIL